MAQWNGLCIFKEPTFEPSSPMHHITELCSILESQIEDKKVFYLCTQMVDLIIM